MTCVLLSQCPGHPITQGRCQLAPSLFEHPGNSLLQYRLDRRANPSIEHAIDMRLKIGSNGLGNCYVVIGYRKRRVTRNGRSGGLPWRLEDCL